MPNRRMVLVGLAGALGWREATAKCDRKCRGRKRVNWCFKHPEQAVGCDELPAETCEKYATYAPYCCAKAKSGWNAFYRCLYA